MSKNNLNLHATSITPSENLTIFSFQLLWEENELMIAYIAYLSTFHTHEEKNNKQTNDTLMLMAVVNVCRFSTKTRKRIF